MTTLSHHDLSTNELPLKSLCSKLPSCYLDWDLLCWAHSASSAASSTCGRRKCPWPLDTAPPRCFAAQFGAHGPQLEAWSAREPQKSKNFYQAFGVRLTPGFQKSSAKMTRWAAVSVMPELAAVIDSTATRHFSSCWKVWHISCLVTAGVAPSIRMYLINTIQ